MQPNNHNMTPNELRIGNYYAHNERIEQVTPSVIMEVWDAPRIWCKPIPLTEEWLLKFGFKKKRLDDAYWYTKSSGKHKPQLITNDIGEDAYAKCLKFVFLDGYDNIRVKYVHQLQNLYYALTGQELTIKTK